MTVKTDVATEIWNIMIAKRETQARNGVTRSGEIETQGKVGGRERRIQRLSVNIHHITYQIISQKTHSYWYVL